VVSAIEKPRGIVRVETKLERCSMQKLVPFVCFITFSRLVFIIRIKLFVFFLQTLGLLKVIRFLLLRQLLPFQAELSADIKVVHLRVFVGNYSSSLLGPKNEGV